jgi:tetratricopeptide (TPR) repeat protein
MKNILKLIVSGILFSILSWTVAYGAVVTFTKEYTYQASEFDSKASSRILALEQVKRLLLEELGTYLISETEVKNFQMTKDQITVFTAGIVSAEVIDEKWDGKTYYLKAKIAADPKDVSKAIDDFRQDKQKTKELEEISRKAAEQAKEIALLKKELEVAKISSSKLSDKVDAKTIQQYKNAVTKLSANDWLMKGMVLSSSRAAIEAYDKAIELDPEYEEAYFCRGMTYLDLSINYQKAIDDINSAIKFHPSRPENGSYTLAEKYSTRAKAYLKSGNYPQALNDLEQVISLDCNADISSAFWKKEDFDDLVNKFPNDYRVFMFRGLFTGHTEQAIADYNRALDINSNSALGNYLLGKAYVKKIFYTLLFKIDPEDINAAVSFLNKAQQLNPPQELLFNIYVKRADTYFHAENYEKSIEDISKAIEMNPQYDTGYQQRAETYNKLGKYQAAIEDYDIAIKLKSSHIDHKIYVGRGDSYSALGDYTAAVKDYSAAIEIFAKERPTNAYIFYYYNKRSKAYEQMGKHQLAKKDFRTGVKMFNFDKKDAERFLKQGQALEGAEDQEGKELTIFNYKTAAILGNKKAQAWLKKKRIEW